MKGAYYMGYRLLSDIKNGFVLKFFQIKMNLLTPTNIEKRTTLLKIGAFSSRGLGNCLRGLTLEPALP